MNGFNFTRGELLQIVGALTAFEEELDAVEESTDFVLTTGVREETVEALIILEAALMTEEEEIDLEGVDYPDYNIDQEGVEDEGT